MAAAARAVTVDVVLVVAVTPAVGVWEEERVRSGVSGGDWLPAVVDGGALPTTEASAGGGGEGAGGQTNKKTRERLASGSHAGTLRQQALDKTT